MEKPVDGNLLPFEKGQRIIDKPELPRQGVFTDNDVYTEVVLGKGQLKRGLFRQFEIFCDEAQRLGGDDLYPPP